MQEFLSITLIIVLAAISPGPDFAIVTKNSLLYSRKAGIYTAIGTAVSIMIHASYCILGLAIVIAHSLLAFSIIKYLGATYLIYIGIKSLLAKAESAQEVVQQSKSAISNAQAFYQGFLCNLLNPKAIMFLLAFFTLVVKPGNSLWLEMCYGLEIGVIHLIWFAGLSVMLTHEAVKANLRRCQFYIVKAMGAALIAFGVRIATMTQVVM